MSNRNRYATGWTATVEHRAKVSERLTGKPYIPPMEVTQTCRCGATFTTVAVRGKTKKHCSGSCAARYSEARGKLQEKARKKRAALTNYRADCAFRFSLNDYPSEFEFGLVEEYGWYKAKNRGDNLNGISRDHIVSVRYGFDNNIDPAIISHPANCRLVQHGENSSKGSQCGMTVDQLLEKIEKWNQRYK